MRRCAALALGVGLAALLYGPSAHAERVLVTTVPMSEGGWPEAEAQASAELRSIDLTPLRSSRPQLQACASNAETRRAIEQRGAVAALELRWMDAERATLRLCVVDLVTGKATVRYFDDAPLPDAAQAALLGVELVHASLIEVIANHPSRGSVQASAGLQRRVDRELLPRRRPLAVRASVAGLQSSGLIDLGAELGADVAFSQLLSIDLSLHLPLLSSSVAGDEGEAGVQPTLIRAGLSWSAFTRGRFTTQVAAGGGALVAHVAANAAEPYVARSELATTWLIVAGLSERCRLSETLGIRLDAIFGYAPTPLEVFFAGRRAISLGQPLVSAALGLEYRF